MSQFTGSLRTGLCTLALLVATYGFAQNGPWTINVKNVQLEDFIEEVATITGKTFIVDPRVKGDVTVISDTKLDGNGVYNLLMTVLKVHDFSMIESGDIVEIIQSARARTVGGSKTAMDDNAGDDAWVTHVIDAGHLDPAEIVKSLRQLAPQHAQFSAINESNAVLISDRKSNVEGMLRVVEHLKDNAAQKTLVVNLKHALSSDIATLLDTLMDDQTSLRLIGNDRNNTLILRGTQNAIMDALETIELIDQPTPNETNTRVFRLGHGDAKTVTGIVSSIVGDGKLQASLTISGTSQSSSTNMSTHSDIRIVADESLNAVVVSANPSVMERIAALIEELDQRRLLVLIESAIVEVDLKGVDSSGVEFGAADRDGDSFPAFSTSINGVLASLLNRLSENDPTASFVNPIEVVGSFSSPTLAIAQLDPDGLSFGAIVNALSTASYAKLLSTPSVMALNNEESNILVGQNVPFRSGNLIFPSEQSVAGLRPTSRNDIGTELKVVPSIHEDKSVRMQIEASIEVIQETPIGIGDTGLADIVTNKRLITTVVVAEDRQTIVLGGLIRNETRASERRVPVLGNVPLLGRLFRAQSETNEQTMLLVFLRPTVIANADDAQEVTGRKYQEYWEMVIGGAADVDQEAEPQPLEDVFKGGSN